MTLPEALFVMSPLTSRCRRNPQRSELLLASPLVQPQHAASGDEPALVALVIDPMNSTELPDDRAGQRSTDQRHSRVAIG